MLLVFGLSGDCESICSSSSSSSSSNNMITIIIIIIIIMNSSRIIIIINSRAEVSEKKHSSGEEVPWEGDSKSAQGASWRMAVLRAPKAGASAGWIQLRTVRTQACWLSHSRIVQQ